MDRDKPSRLPFESAEDGERDGMGQLALNSEAQKTASQEKDWELHSAS